MHSTASPLVGHARALISHRFLFLTPPWRPSHWKGRVAPHAQTPHKNAHKKPGKPKNRCTSRLRPWCHALRCAAAGARAVLTPSPAAAILHSSCQNAARTWNQMDKGARIGPRADKKLHGADLSLAREKAVRRPAACYTASPPLPSSGTYPTGPTPVQPPVRSHKVATGAARPSST